MKSTAIVRSVELEHINRLEWYMKLTLSMMNTEPNDCGLRYAAGSDIDVTFIADSEKEAIGAAHTHLGTEYTVEIKPVLK